MINQTTTNLLQRVRFSAAIGLILIGAFHSETILMSRAQTARPSPSSSERGGQKEGIKVHGHWTIEVRNPDGTVATHNEFENALVASGGMLIASFLARASTPGQWMIWLRGDGAGNGPWGQNNGTLTEPLAPGSSGFGISKNLTVSFPTNAADPNLNKVVLAGRINAEQDGAIRGVTTFLSQCAVNVTPETCGQTAGNATHFDFSNVNLPLPPCAPNAPCAVSVVAGQIIQVNVVFSFS